MAKKKKSEIKFNQIQVIGTPDATENDDVKPLSLSFAGSKLISSLELAEYISLFREAYNMGVIASEFSRLPNVPQSLGPEEFVVIYNDYERRKRQKSLVDMSIKRITFNSPLVITFIGLTTALTFAVIFTGGELEIKPLGLKVKLPSLGEGIKSLRHSLKDTNLPQRVIFETIEEPSKPKRLKAKKKATR